MEKIHYVYRHIRHDKNEVFYVGIGKTKNYNRAYNKRKRNSFWKNIVNKTSFTVEIIFDNLTEDEAKQREIELVSFYGRKDLQTGTLVNLTNGGDGTNGYKHSEEYVQMLKERNTGYKHTDEAKEKIRYAASHISEETRAKMSKSRKGIKRVLSQEALDKMAIGRVNARNNRMAKKQDRIENLVSL